MLGYLTGYTFMKALLGAIYPTAWTTWFEYHDTEPRRPRGKPQLRVIQGDRRIAGR